MKPHEIKELRKEKKLNQAQFGEICGVSSASVSRWENDIDSPSGGALKILEQLKEGTLVVSHVTELEAKLLDQNVNASIYDNREDYLTASLKYLLMHGEFMPLAQQENSKATQRFEGLKVAEAETPYGTNIIDPITEENETGGKDNKNQA